MAPTFPCRAIVISCMDWRLWPALDELLRQRLEGGFDRLLVAGGTLALVRPPDAAVSDYLLSCVDLAYRAHGVRHAVLVAHNDCGAYGGRKAFADETTERAFLTADLKAGGAKLRERWPDLQTTCLYAVLTKRDEGGYAVRIEEAG